MHAVTLSCDKLDSDKMYTCTILSMEVPMCVQKCIKRGGGGLSGSMYLGIFQTGRNLPSVYYKW